MLKRLDCPWGGGRVQRLHALASRQPALGRPELWQGQGHGGIQHWPQDALVAPSDFRALGPLAANPTGATALDLLLSWPLLPQCGAPRQPGPGQWLRGGGDPRDVGVVSTTLEAVCGITQCDFADLIFFLLYLNKWDWLVCSWGRSSSLQFTWLVLNLVFMFERCLLPGFSLFTGYFKYPSRFWCLSY